nr:hypothetical protein [Pseudomonas sp. BIGb0427]
MLIGADRPSAPDILSVSPPLKPCSDDLEFRSGNRAAANVPCAMPLSRCVAPDLDFQASFLRDQGMSQLPYLDFSPFADEDWQGWEKGPNGAQLKLFNEEGNYYLRFENPQGFITGQILNKTVSGFIPGNLYRFSVDFRRNMEEDYWRPVVKLAVLGIGHAPEQAIVEPHWVTFSFDFVATDNTHTLEISTFDRAPNLNACSPRRQRPVFRRTRSPLTTASIKFAFSNPAL